jgi:hypothetical protein
MGSLIGELKRREVASRAEADRLRSRIEELARAEEQASRLAIAWEEVARVLEEPAAAEPPAGQNGRPEGQARPASPIGAVTVPPCEEGSDASVLPQAYQDLLEVAADAGRPLWAGEFAGRCGAGRGQGEGRGPAVEAEAAGRAGLAGRGARRPVHAARSRRENSKSRTVTGSSSQVRRCKPIRTSGKKNPHGRVLRGSGTVSQP